MLLVKWALIGLLVLPAAEIVTFIVVAALIGWLPAGALFMATSIVGVWLLRRSGRADLERLRAGLAQDGLRAVHLERPGVAPMLGGILLVFPGFITDLLGAALFVPVLRRWATARLADAARKRRRRPDDDRVIDLAPDEYHQLLDHTRSRRGKSDDGATVRTKNRIKGSSRNPDDSEPQNGPTSGPKNRPRDAS
jgi:UPF0716 family protein affecting phage T7 exclusion